MSEIQRRVVVRLSRYVDGDFAHIDHLASFLGRHRSVISYHARKLQMRGLLKSKMGPGGGYALTRNNKRL